MNQSTALIQLCADLANRCSSSAAASCESYSLVLRQTQLFFDSSFVWFLFFPSLVFSDSSPTRLGSFLACQFQTSRIVSNTRRLFLNCLISFRRHKVSGSGHGEPAHKCTQPADMFMLQLGWESRVGSNYMCLVLLRILAAACSTFGPKGPRVERDRSFGFYSNTRHI